MNNKQTRNFWDAAFSPDRDFIAVFLIMLLATTLFGNLIYSLLTDAESISFGEAGLTTGIILFLLLIAGFLWSQRKRKYIPFHVSETNRLERSRAVIAIPSNPGMIGKIVRYHAGTLQYLWLVGDKSLDGNYEKCAEDYRDYAVKFERVTVSAEENVPTIFDAYKKAFQEALALGVSRDEITVDITGGKKPMSINAFLLALEQKLKVSYVESNYEQIQGNDEIKRSGEAFQVIQFDFSMLPSQSIYKQSDSTPGNE